MYPALTASGRLFLHDRSTRDDNNDDDDGDEARAEVRGSTVQSTLDI